MSVAGQPVPDSALIERIMAQDENALSAVYDRYSGMVFSVLVRILKDSQAAEEVLQDLFLQLWREAQRFDSSRGSLPAWLMVIARNRAISRLRGRNRRALVETSEELPTGYAPWLDNVEQEAARAEMVGKVKAAMREMPREQRQVVELAYFEGMTQTEIAAHTGTPLGTVKTRMRTAIQSLRQLFDDGTARQSGRS